MKINLYQKEYFRDFHENDYNMLNSETEINAIDVKIEEKK